MEDAATHQGIFQDFRANRGNVKAQLVLMLFRLATVVRRNRVLIIFFCWYLIIYRVLVEWFLGIELPWSLRAGSGLRLDHGQALVINGESRLGQNVHVRHSTTIGNKKLADGTYSACPRIGNNVDIGAQVCIIGDIEIGDNVIIGVGSIVVKSIAPNCVVVGNPARVIKENTFGPAGTNG
ncbi:satase isoform II [Hymenobacter roseosalivarius DSM 11622]|uniref:Serine acetyltransferase n=1 Tax=Hymenobacter roseosalivarius DSM 11622 TaxID=645990 RepID=A0A1W1W5F3_9BACT|nr:serine acetyltransferase [Hymenobacter roseosalivarius]SMC00621.1 satase isoform II [Hymenobacter roseosalivarius DSM 11622]